MSRPREGFVRRTWDLDQNIVERFDRWREIRGMQWRVAIELGLWLVMNLEPADRDLCLEAYAERRPIKIQVTVEDKDSSGAEKRLP